MNDERGRIAVFSGTTEGRLLSEALAELGIPHTVFVATEYGEVLQKKSDLIRIEEGRKTREDMEALFSSGVECVADATHPFATEVTSNIRAALQGTGVRYLRVLRETESRSTEGVSFFDSPVACAIACEALQGNLLFTTGSRDLSVMCERIREKDRIFVRVLPSVESIRLAEQAGIRQDHIPAMQGPFTEEMNLAVIRQYGIAALITKESGVTGGVDQKLSACKAAGIPCLCIRRPVAEEGISVEAATTEISRIYKSSGTGEPEVVTFHLIGMGMGDPKGLTIEADQALRRADVCFGAARLLSGVSCKEKHPYFRAREVLEKTAELLAKGSRIKEAAVLFSGDTGFYSGATGFEKELTEGAEGLRDRFLVRAKRYPGISCISALSARLSESYSDAEIVSLHGRSDPEHLSDAVGRITRSDKSYVLFSSGDEVAELSRQLIREGFSATITLGKDLSYPEEQLETYTLEEAAERISGRGLYTGLIRRSEKSVSPEIRTSGTEAARTEVETTEASGIKPPEASVRRLLIAAPKSGSGKTLITCGLLQLLLQKGLDVTSFKCGPDYIDPMFHDRVLGVGGGNLDTFFSGREGTVRLLSDCGHSHAVLEGVMGIYDGLGGLQLTASCYEVAEATGTPILLVADGRGVGRTLISEILGILKDDTEHLIRGILLNRVSEGFYDRLRRALEEELRKQGYDIAVVGFLPTLKDVKLESRHLGLLRPEEIPGIREMLETVAGALERCADIPTILRIMESAEALPEREKTASDPEQIGQGLRLAVARDEAFCFYYRENLRCLERLGVEIVSFSPLHDAALPEGIHGIYLGGGYPELYLRELSGNTSMREEIGERIRAGLPSIAECGGFMYLHQSISDEEGEPHPMVGVIPGSCRKTGRLQRFGYVELHTVKQGRLSEALEGMRGHEFHYYESTDCGADMLAVKAGDEREWHAMHAEGAHVWGFPHLFFDSCPGFAEHFTEVMRDGCKV